MQVNVHFVQDKFKLGRGVRAPTALSEIELEALGTRFHLPTHLLGSGGTITICNGENQLNSVYCIGTLI